MCVSIKAEWALWQHRGVCRTGAGGCSARSARLPCPGVDSRSIAVVRQVPAKPGSCHVADAGAGVPASVRVLRRLRAVCRRRRQTTAAVSATCPGDVKDRQRSSHRRRFSATTVRLFCVRSLLTLLCSISCTVQRFSDVSSLVWSRLGPWHHRRLASADWFVTGSGLVMLWHGFVRLQTCVWDDCGVANVVLWSGSWFTKYLTTILRLSYEIMPKFQSTYDGRLIYQTSYKECKAFLRYSSLAKSWYASLHLAPDR